MAGADLPRSAGYPFYERLNGILEAGGFDELVESECAQFHAERMASESLSGPVLSSAAGGLLRGSGLGARDRVACSDSLSIVGSWGWA